MVATYIGLALFGIALGFITGLSESEGASHKALSVLGGLGGAGGLIVWSQGIETVGIILGTVSFGFLLGVVVGAILRKFAILNVMLPL